MSYIFWILPPLILLSLVVFGILKVRHFSKSFFGTPDLLEGLRQQKWENSFKPKSLHSMEAVYLPRIQRDFPGLNIEELKKKSESILLSAFQALASKNERVLNPDAGKEIREKVQSRIRELQQTGRQQVYDRLRIHKTVVSDYKKDHGQVWLILQIALEGYIYLLDGNKLLEGEREVLSQCVYTLTYLYVQDEERLGGKEVLGLQCPHCGAPVKTLGHKFCDYCGSGIQEVNLRVWHLIDYKRE